MFPYFYGSNPYGSNIYGSSPYGHNLSDSEYFRALAEESAAREQYAAARRAQEEARQRAARARAARRAFASPYSSYHDDDLLNNDLSVDPLVMDLGDSAYLPRQRPMSYAEPQRPLSSGFAGFTPYSQRAYLEEQRRRELLEEQRRRELLELEREKERRRLEEERIRRILQEERQREELARQKALEEERLRRALEEEKLRRAMEEEKIRRALFEEEEARRERERTQARKQQQDALEPLLRALGFVPAHSNSDTESDKVSRLSRYICSQGPSHQPLVQERPSRETRTKMPSSTNGRRTAPSPSPIRPFPFGRPSPISPQRSGEGQESPKTPSSAQSTRIPINSPKPKAQAPPTAEQNAAAEKIQEAYRAYSSRKQSLKSVASLRKRFLTARNGFTLPLTIDYDISTNGRIPTPVVVDPSVSLPTPSEEFADPLDGIPKLAYTPTNAPLHGYEEELNRILNALDAVESHGDQGVRAARRELARAVEREAERVERWRAIVWTWYKTEQEKAKASAAPVVLAETKDMEVEPLAQSSESMTTDVQPTPMEVDPLSASAESPQPVDAHGLASFADTPGSEVRPVEEAPSTPEVDIPDAEESAQEVVPATEGPSVLEIDITDAEEPARPLEIIVEPLSRAEPPSELDSPSAVESESEIVRSPTPPLSHEHGDEMEVEPQEVHTPSSEPLPVEVNAHGSEAEILGNREATMQIEESQKSPQPNLVTQPPHDSKEYIF